MLLLLREGEGERPELLGRNWRRSVLVLGLSLGLSLAAMFPREKDRVVGGAEGRGAGAENRPFCRPCLGDF